MNSIFTSASTPEIDDAFDKVIEAFGVAISTQLSSTVRQNAKTILAVTIAIVCIQLGVLLFAFVLRDALVSTFPEQPILAVTSLGFLFVFAAIVLLAFSVPHKKELNVPKPTN